MTSDDFAAKAEEMMNRAESAQTERARTAYLRAAQGWEALARKRQGGPEGSPEVEKLRAEMKVLGQHVVALESAFGIAISLLKRTSPGFGEALARVKVEPHPDTAADRLDELRKGAAHVSRLLGKEAPAPARASPVPTEQGEG